MSPQEYIMTKLGQIAEPVHITEVAEDELHDAILAKVLSKKFRKYKADAQLLEIAHKAINHAITNNKPLIIGALFGGNKLWRFDEAPEVDWAELFNLIYFIEWARTIAAIYKPGVILDYYSQDISIETLNNVPHEETDQYTETFLSLIDFLRPYTPVGVKVSYRRHADELSSREEYKAEIEEAKLKILANNGGKLPKLTEHERLATELNVKLLPGQDQDPEWREKVELEHRAIFETKSLLPYLTDESIIPTCPTPYPGCLATGSTRKSLAKFWAGIGALEPKENRYVEIVLTPKQLETAQYEWKPMNIAGLKGKNFSRIRVLNKNKWLHRDIIKV